MKYFLPVLTVATLTFTSAYAMENNHDDARIEHYQGVELKNDEAAIALLNEKMNEIETALKSEDINAQILENVHESSYALEDAVDKLRDEESDNEALDNLDEAVQALHYASENHETEKTKEWFAKMQEASAAYQAPEEANVQDKPLVKQEFYEIVIKDHKFTPETLIVPAGKKIKLIVDNQDATPEEFESHDFNREKIIAGKTKATIFVGPLEPGKYHYFGEFNMKSANGYIVAEAVNVEGE